MQYVGDLETARKYCNAKTQTRDYGQNTVYPGFCESHAHGIMAAPRLLLEADLSEPASSMQDFVDRMKKYVEANPGREIYRGAGWFFITSPDAEMLDAISPDVPMVLTSVDAHSMWLNTAAMMKLAPQIKPTKEELKQGLLKWQEFAFAHGFTAASECYVNPTGEEAIEAYRELVEEGEWKLRTYAVYCIDEKEKDVDGKLQRALELFNEGGEYFSIGGIKVFMDGVIEAHTGWLIDPYVDQTDYYGLKRGEDIARIEKIVSFANENGLYVHFHAIGDEAIKTAVDAICASEDSTGIRDARNIIAHLQIVRPEDIKRMGEYKIMAAVAPLWATMGDSAYEQMVGYIGKQRLQCSDQNDRLGRLSKGSAYRLNRNIGPRGLRQ